MLVAAFLASGCSITVQRHPLAQPQPVRCECACPDEDSCPDGAICGNDWSDEIYIQVTPLITALPTDSRK